MKRIAILGSTGSIGQSALAVAAAHPDRLQVVGLSAGENIARFVEQVARFAPDAIAMATPGRAGRGARGAGACRPASRADRCQRRRGAHRRRHPSRRGPRPLRHVRHGGARCRARRHRGGQDHRAREQGNSRDGRGGRDGGGAPPGRRRAAGRQRAQRDSPVPPRARGVRGAAPDSHRVRRSVPRSLGRRPARGHARGRAPAPDLANGAEDHHRLRHADEQGARGDRGALAVRRRPRADRRARAPAVDRALDGRARGRLDHRPARRHRHAAAHPVRVLVSRTAGRRRWRRSIWRGRAIWTSKSPTRRGSRASGWRSAR